MKKDDGRVARLALFGLIAAVGILFVGAGVALGQGRVPPLEHFRCYIVSEQTPQAATEVGLDDQFTDEEVLLTVDEPLQFCAPTSKNEEPIEVPEQHLTMYAAAANLTPHLSISTRDQFGERTLEAVSARVLLVPTQKMVGGLPFPEELNHFWCYEVEGERVGQKVTLEDQFSGPDSVRVAEPKLFCNPVTKTINGVVEGEIFDVEAHLTCYEIKGKQKTEATTFGIHNQLEDDEFTVTAWELLCVPSEKLDFTPVP